MFRRNHLVFLAAGLAVALGACVPTPTTSVSTLSYQVQPTAQRGTADTAASPAQPASRAAAAAPAAPAQIGPNDPLRLLDMP